MFPIALPPRGSGARLPALLAPLLAGMAVLQLALPGSIALPAAGVAANRNRDRPPGSAPPVIADPVLAAHALFAPILAPTAGTAPLDPLGGAVIAGVVQQGRRRVAVIQSGDGRLRYIGAGGLVAGWRIASLGAAGASLTRGHDHLEVAYGAHATAPRPTFRPTPEDPQ